MRRPNPKDEPRRQKLKDLIDEHGGHASFVKRFNLSGSQASQISQIVNGYSFGEKAAEKLREVLKLQAGYFDVEDNTDKQSTPLTRDQKKVLALMDRMKDEGRGAWIKIGNILADLNAEDRRQNNTERQPDRRHQSGNTSGFQQKPSDGDTGKRKEQ